MKKTLLAIAIVCAALALTSCDKDDGEPKITISDNQLRWGDTVLLFTPTFTHNANAETGENFYSCNCNHTPIGKFALATMIIQFEGGALGRNIDITKVADCSYCFNCIVIAEQDDGSHTQLCSVGVDNWLDYRTHDYAYYTMGEDNAPQFKSGTLRGELSNGTLKASLDAVALDGSIFQIKVSGVVTEADN